MTIIPDDELMAMPYDASRGSLMLAPKAKVVELGNKKNASGLYRDWYLSQGCEYVCIDWNGQDGAIKMDLGKSFVAWDEIDNADLVTNFGFMEHVYTDQVQGWFNVAYLSRKVGCYLAMVMPTPGYWEHHGVYQPHAEWYGEWCAENGYEMFTFTEYDFRKRHTFVVGAQRVEPFDGNKYHHPSDRHIHITPWRSRANKEERNCGIR